MKITLKKNFRFTPPVKTYRRFKEEKHFSSINGFLEKPFYAEQDKNDIYLVLPYTGGKRTVKLGEMENISRITKELVIKKMEMLRRI